MSRFDAFCMPKLRVATVTDAWRRGIVCAATASLLTGLTGCNDLPDACVGYGVGFDPSLTGCGGTAVRVLAHSSHSLADYNAQVAQSHPSLALDADDVYWSDIRGRVLRTPKVGGATVEVLAAHGCSVADLAVDDVAVYVGENCLTGSASSFPVAMRILRVDKATFATTELVRAQDAQAVRVVVANATVFFGMDTLTQTFVRSVSRDGPLQTETDPFTPIAVLRSNWYLPMVASSDSLYIVGDYWTPILRWPLDGSTAPATVYTHDRPIRAMASGGASLLGVDQQIVGTTLSYRGFAWSPSTGEMLLDTDVQIAGLVGDDLGWYAYGSSAVAPTTTAPGLYRLGLAGTPSELLAAGFERIQEVDLDGERLYVLDETYYSDQIRLISVARRDLVSP